MDWLFIPSFRFVDCESNLLNPIVVCDQNLSRFILASGEWGMTESAFYWWRVRMSPLIARASKQSNAMPR
jgi:hypothetical protein